MSIAEKLNQIAENEPKIYAAGKYKGRDDFWKRYVTNEYGRKNWDSYGLLYGVTFGFNNFYPTVDIKPIGSAIRLFYAWEAANGPDHAGSLKQRLEECGVVLDTSQATNLTHGFSYTFITEIPTIDCSSLTNTTTHLFAYGYGRINLIEKIIVHEDVTFANWFLNSAPLEVRFEGVIGNSLDISYGTRLSLDSMKNIISCLKDYSGTEKEYINKLTFHAERWEALEADSKAPDGNTWREYVFNLGWNT